jgi:hypothetical protein
VKNISIAALAALVALAIVSLACGSGNRLVSIAVSFRLINTCGTSVASGAIGEILNECTGLFSTVGRKMISTLACRNSTKSLC